MSVESAWQASDAELLAELRELETRMRSTWAQMLSVVAEVDSRSIAGKEGYGTTVELIRALARVTRGEARARVDAAADVLAGRGLDGTSIAPRGPRDVECPAGNEAQGVECCYPGLPGLPRRILARTRRRSSGRQVHPRLNEVITSA